MAALRWHSLYSSGTSLGQLTRQPKMSDAIESLLARFAEGRRPPVSLERLSEASSRLGFQFPDQLTAFYRKSDGLVVHKLRLVLKDLTDAVKYAEAIHGWDFARCLGLFPLSESNDSNPYCVACSPLLFGRVIHVRHDDAPRLAFRCLDEFATAVLSLCTGTNWHIDDLPLGYNADHSDRSPADDVAADALLAADCPDVENVYSITTSLFSRARAHSLIALLEHENMWVREDAAIHLGYLGDVTAIDPLAQLAKGDRQDNRAAQRALKALNRLKYGA